MTEQMNHPDVDRVPHPSANEVVHMLHWALWTDWDVRTAWPLLDPVLRVCWVQHWHTHLQRKVARGLGDRDELLAGLVVDEPHHRFWAFFEASAVELLAGMGPADGCEWGVSAEPHLMAPDVELLALWPVPGDPTTPVAPGSPHVPMLMRYDPAIGWRLLNLFSVDEPVPGWPPVL